MDNKKGAVRMKNMRFQKVFLVIFFTLIVSAYGCSAEKNQELLLATGGTAGTYFPLGGAIANTWNQKVDGVNVTTQATGASVENMRLLSTKETELAISINSIADDAYQGKGVFEAPITNIRAIGVLYPEVVQIVTQKNSGIKEIEDMNGKRVSLGPAGSGTAVAAEHILTSYGMAKGDIVHFQDTFAEAADKLKDGNLDVGFSVLSVPAGSIEDISTATDVHLVSITGAGLDVLKAEYPFYTEYTIPANTYKGQTEDVQTITMQAVLYVRKDIDEETVYELTKALYENRGEIAQGYAIGEQISLERALDGVTVPLHPGAEKYFKEKGMR